MHSTLFGRVTFAPSYKVIFQTLECVLSKGFLALAMSLLTELVFSHIRWLHNSLCEFKLQTIFESLAFLSLSSSHVTGVPFNDAYRYMGWLLTQVRGGA